MQVGFIGLGLMGGAMSANLIKGGFTVKGFDIFPKALEALTACGGMAAKSVLDAVTDADCVITMLPNSPHVLEAALGPDGIEASMRKEALYIDASTIMPDVTRRIGARFKEKGLRMIDAAVGRTSVEAAAGKLLFMVGGDPEDVEQARPYLEKMGDTIMHCGNLGSGVSAKLVNNYMTTTLNVLTAEALALAQSLGLEQDRILEVLRGTAAGRGHINTTYPAKVLLGDVSPAFMIDLAYKDLGLALDLGAMNNVPLATGSGARQVYTLARAQGRGQEDWTAMLLGIKDLAGLDH